MNWTAFFTVICIGLAAMLYFGLLVLAAIKIEKKHKEAGWNVFFCGLTFACILAFAAMVGILL